MARLLAAFALLAVLVLLLLSFGGLPSGATNRRRSKATAPPARTQALEDAVIAARKAAFDQRGVKTSLRKLGRWCPRPGRGVSWVLYLTLVAGAIVSIPRVLSWGLDTPQPLAAVSGSSMWPTLNRGDLVLLQGVDGVEDLEVGDIIAFRQEQGFSIHRVVSIDGQTITTRGDGNFVNDPPVTIDDVMGKVARVAGHLVKIPLLGHLSLIFGPGLHQDRDFHPQEEKPLSWRVRDLAEENAGRVLGPVDDLSKQRLADGSEGPLGAPHRGSPTAELREGSLAPESTAVTGSPVEDLATAEQ